VCAWVEHVRERGWMFKAWRSCMVAFGGCVFVRVTKGISVTEKYTTINHYTLQFHKL